MNKIKTVLIILIISFLATVVTIMLPDLRLLDGKMFFLTGAIFLISGLLLLVFLAREKISGKLGIFLILTGISAVGFIPLVVLHNMFYAFAIAAFPLPRVSGFFTELEVIGFLLAVIGCPIGFIVGIIGSLILIFKRKSGKK